MRREEAFPGPAMVDAPDLTLMLNDFGFVSVRDKTPVVAARAYPAGTHHPDGIFIAAGPGIANDASRQLVQLIDVPSMLMHSLGLPVPADFEGTVPRHLLTGRRLGRAPAALGRGPRMRSTATPRPTTARPTPSARKFSSRCARSATSRPEVAHVVVSSGRIGVAQIPQVGRRGADDVVMIHGLGANLGFWYAGAVEWFRRFGRVTLYDLPGHGDSDMPVAGYSPAQLADGLAELLDQLAIARAHVVAHSFGGSVALAFAVRHPHRVKCLVLADVRLWAVEPPCPAGEGTARVQRLRDAGLTLADDRWDASVQVLVELARLRIASDEPIAAIGEIVPGARALFSGRRAARKWLKLVETTDAYAEMTDPAALSLAEIAQIEQPMLLVYGAHSSCARSAEAILAACKRARLQVVPEVGHFFPLTRPRLFARIALAFLRSMARARRRRRKRAERLAVPARAPSPVPQAALT